MPTIFKEPQTKIHFCAISGNCLSGIAAIAHSLGFQRLQGSDMQLNELSRALQSKGITVFGSQVAEQITPDIEAIIKSTAVPETNPEIIQARALGIPVYSREEALVDLVQLYEQCFSITGCHGKTSTSAMATSLLDACGLAPTALVGGIMNQYHTNTLVGDRKWIVIEADESDGTFNKTKRDVGIINNIDVDHLENFQHDFKVLQEEFVKYANGIEAEGMCIVNLDDAITRELLPRIQHPHLRSYAVEASRQPDTWVHNIRQQLDGLLFDVRLRCKTAQPVTYCDLWMPLYGQHQVLNVAGVITALDQMGATEAQLRAGLQNCTGVQRRFTQVGEYQGSIIIDDYAHHPTEIAALLQTGKALLREAGQGGKLIAVCQPHRYTRLNDVLEQFYSCWQEADLVLLSKVCSVREDAQRFTNITQQGMGEQLRQRGVSVVLLEDLEHLAAVLKPHLASHDLVICLGAGDISSYAHQLAGKLAELA